MNRAIIVCLLLFAIQTFASNIMPVGSDNNAFYYRIGGASDYALPPISETDRINLDTNTNLGLGFNCSTFNPAISIINSLNNLKDSLDNLTKDIITNVTGSIIMLPGYELAKRNPSLYALLNNYLLSAHRQLEISTKSCQIVKEQISRGENPYQDWGTIAVNEQWKKKLSLAASGDADINQAKKEIDKTSGDEGVAWANGDKANDGSFHAGGKNQPPVHVIADTMKAGYNAMLNRDLQSDAEAPTTGTSAELARVFPTPTSAMNWFTNVVGDQTITTCNDDVCKKKQGSVVGHGLVTNVTACRQDKDNCMTTIRDHLGKLVTGHEAITKDNLEKVSADGILISPEVISSIHNMDTTQQSIIINKIAQEVAIQRVIDKAFMAKNILATGAQVPVIVANHPAQVIIARAMTKLDNDIRSLLFENQIRKQMMSDTLSQVLHFSNQQQLNTLRVAPVSSNQPLMENGALVKGGKN